MSLLIGSRADVLVTYLRFPSTEGFFSRWGQGRRPDAAIDDCHLSHCRRAEPMVTKAVRAKLQLFARKRAVRGGMLRETDTGEREAPPGKINANDR